MLTTMRIFLILMSLNLIGCASWLTKKVENPHFWVGHRGDKTVYLLGTASTSIRLDEIPDRILDQLKQSELLILPGPPQTAANPVLQRFLAQADRGIVYSVLSPRDFSLYKSFYSRTRLGQAFLKKNHKVETDNYFLGSLIVQNFIEETVMAEIDKINKGNFAVKRDFIKEVNEASRGLDSDVKMQESIHKMALKKDLVFDYLDKDLSVIVELEKRGAEAKFNKLFEFAKSIDKNNQEAIVYFYQKVKTSRDLVDLYRSGKPVEYGSYFDKLLGAELQTQLLEKRVESWGSVFSSIDKGYQQIFIAVDAPYLYGPSNLRTLLEKQGFTLVREKN